MGSSYSREPESSVKVPIKVYSYTPVSKPIFDPIYLVIRFLELDLQYETPTDNDVPFIDLYEDGEERIHGELAILKFLGKCFCLYPNKIKKDAAIVDTWLEHFLCIKRTIKSKETGLITSDYNFFEYIKRYLDLFDESICGNEFIEMFDSPTIADFCWLCVLEWIFENEDYKHIVENKYDNIKVYIIGINSYISSIENGEDEEDSDESDESDTKLFELKKS